MFKQDWIPHSKMVTHLFRLKYLTRHIFLLPHSGTHRACTLQCLSDVFHFTAVNSVRVVYGLVRIMWYWMWLLHKNHSQPSTDPESLMWPLCVSCSTFCGAVFPDLSTLLGNYNKTRTVVMKIKTKLQQTIVSAPNLLYWKNVSVHNFSKRGAWSCDGHSLATLLLFNFNLFNKMFD